MPVYSPDNMVSEEACHKFQKTMTEKIDKIADTMEAVNKSVNDVKVDIASLPQRIFEKADDRYASKTVENAIYAMIGTILLAVMGAVMTLILK